MAVRLQMKLGVVPEHDRLPDSPDTIVVVEPSVGSVARTKGHLYLLVTLAVAGSHALEATRLVAETIRNEYYYDESAGIRVCIQKADPGREQAARPPARPARPGVTADGDGPIGVGGGRRPRQRAVRRDGRAGRGLPHPPGAPVDPARPASRARPARPATSSPRSGAARSPSATRSCLVSPNVVAQARARRAQGRDGHAPPAVRDGAPPPPVRRDRRHGQRRRGRLRGDRGLGRPTSAARSSRSGRRSRWPARRTARRSRSPTTSQAAGGRAARPPASAQGGRRRGARPRRRGGSRTCCRRRQPANRRVTPLAIAPGDAAPGGDRAARAGRGRRRRSASASTPSAAAPGRPGAIDSVTAGPAAFEKAQADLAKVIGPGVDLVADDPGRRRRCSPTRTSSSTRPSRPTSAAADDRRRCGRRSVDGLDRLYGVVPVGLDDAVQVQARGRRGADRPRRAGQRPRRRAVRARPVDARRSTASTSRTRRRRSCPRRRPAAAGSTRRDAQDPRRRVAPTC